jgi:DNA-binding PadR family transcriptional regulator
MSMKLVILGILTEGEKHPYEIQHIMKEREMDLYIKLQKGSLYYAVEQLLDVCGTRFCAVRRPGKN